MQRNKKQKYKVKENFVMKIYSNVCYIWGSSFNGDESHGASLF